MNLNLDINNDLKMSIFVQLLQQEYLDNIQYLSTALHPDDIKMFNKNIKACSRLLDYYGG
jgi:hypothetical protein